MSFYTYLWLREYDSTFPAGTPYYVGKGRGRRAFRGGTQHRFRPPKNKEAIIIQEWPDENSAFEGEKFLIAMYGRIDNGTGCLRNLTDGGEGSSGHPTSKLQKLKASKQGKIIGKYNVESGRLASLRTKEHQSKAGYLGASKHSPKQKDHCKKIASLGGKFSTHIRWHVNRGKIKEECELCNIQSQDTI
jgi:hypothetical protein